MLSSHLHLAVFSSIQHIWPIMYLQTGLLLTLIKNRVWMAF